MTPRGKILETTRMVVSREVERDESGRETVRTLTVSGCAVLITLAEGSENRHKFWKYVKKHGMATRVVETAFCTEAHNCHGKFRSKSAVEVPHVVQVLGSGDAFLRLPFQRFVADWDNILNVQAPHGGSHGWDGHSRTPGDASPRVKRECSMRRMPLAAQAEADRREMWDASDKMQSLLAEAAELPRTDSRRMP